jgi:hypothetical protein
MSGQQPTGRASNVEVSMRLSSSKALAAAVICAFGQPASADVIADWNENAVSFGVMHNIGPPPAERIIAMIHVAMFDAVNSIERKYQPYLVQLPATQAASKEAAAAAAAGTILVGINPQAQATMKTCPRWFKKGLSRSGALEPLSKKADGR